ncbi:MAG: thioredoxin family protein [Bacteroidales bacterium]|nr:thioredoxin family protein [Bacteroidales bacterium]
MYKSLIFIFQVLLITQLFGQEINQTMIDTSRDQEILIGDCNREGLLGEVFGDNFDIEYDLYTPDPDVMANLGLYNGDYNIIIVLGSWCGDSREQVPRFLRIIDMLGLTDNAIRIIAVDRTKSAGDLEKEPEVALNTERVPTFILINEGIEMGRIIETPEETLELDVLKILQDYFK